MKNVLTTHTLFEWREGQEYYSQFVNRLDPRCPDYERKPGVRRTAVRWKYLYPDSMEGFWVDANGRHIGHLPWQDV